MAISLSDATEHQDLNSCFYECNITHERYQPKGHKFSIKTFLFAIDLDEIDKVAQSLVGFGTEWWQPYRWVDKDWMPVSGEKAGKTAKARVTHYLDQSGLDIAGGRVLLIGQPRVLGYAYNPASFFICWNKLDKPIATIMMVDNTFRELKPYIIPAVHQENSDTIFSANHLKHFYVSPFLNLDDEFLCRLTVPNHQLHWQVSTQRKSEIMLNSVIKGKRHPMSTTKLLTLACRYPLFPQLTMLGIHWHALLLWLKGIAFNPKEENINLQKNYIPFAER